MLQRFPTQHPPCSWLGWKELYVYPNYLAGQTWRLQQHLEKERPTQASIWALASVWANNLTLLWCLARRNKADIPFPWEAALLISSANWESQLWPLWLCAAGQCWTLWFAHHVPPKCNCNYKGNNTNIGFLHILKPNCYNHQVIVSDASSSLACPAGLHPSATAFFLRTALLDSATLRAGWSVLFPGVKHGYHAESDLGSHLVIVFSLATRKVVIGDWRASLEQNTV